MGGIAGIGTNGTVTVSCGPESAIASAAPRKQLRSLGGRGAYLETFAAV